MFDMFFLVILGMFSLPLFLIGGIMHMNGREDEFRSIIRRHLKKRDDEN